MGVSRGCCELGGSSRVCRLLRRRRQPYSTRGRGEDRDRVGQQSHKDLHAWTGYPGLGRLPVVHGPSRPGQPLGGVGIYPAGGELAQARPAAVRAIPDLSGEQIQRATHDVHPKLTAGALRVLVLTLVMLALAKCLRAFGLDPMRSVRTGELILER